MIHKSKLAQTIVITMTWFLAASDVALAAEKTEEGFISLFDGKTLDGWHLMNSADFVVVDGAIQHDHGGGWLRSDKEYADFILRLELRFMEPKQDGGIFLRASKEGRNWPDQRYEVQCENSERMAKLFNVAYDLNVDLAKKALKPNGEWNEYEIRIVGPSIEVRLNGELVTTSNAADALKRGYLGLQGEYGYQQYRNIRIKDLGK